MSRPQRRASQRVSMTLPVEIRWKGRGGARRQALGRTDNISGTGLFIEVDARPRPETPVRMKVLLPREVTRVPLELWCQGRVVRWNRQGRSQGVGAVIDEYELRPVEGGKTRKKRLPRSK